MWHRISEILLVSSPYDAYILEQDGQLTEQVFREYSKLSLPAPPRFTHAASGEQAMELLEVRKFDLVMTMTSLAGMDVNAFGRRVKALRPGRPVVLLALDRAELHDLEGQIDRKAIDGVFLWSGDPKILLAIIKFIEDKDNVDLDIQHGNIKIILVIEDSPYYYSLFLGLLYKELTAQALSLYSEGANEIMAQMYMKSRPKILLATTYEEGAQLFDRYKNSVMAVISDMRIPRDGELDPQAGLELVERARLYDPDLPVLLQSAEPFHAREAEAIRASYLDKNSRNLLAGVRRFVTETLGFGDFVFRDPERNELARASDLREFEDTVATIPLQSLVYHASHNHFSIWLMARSEFALADRIRPVRIAEFEHPEEARRFLIEALRENRRDTHRGVVADFHPRRFDRNPFVRLGHGALGGKARGLAFLNVLLADLSADEFGGLEVDIPRSVVITTEHFDEFLEANDLLDFAVNCDDEDLIQERFLAAELSVGLVESLGIILEQRTEPLAVRSSSLLEDSMHQRMAGIYDTLMLPNNAKDAATEDSGGLPRRLREVCDAIKLVYASTFLRNAKVYLAGMGKRVEEEKMAVILQELVGQHRGPRFYPSVSGVAQSHNFYPVGPQKPGDGVAFLALGFGRLIVDGGQALRFVPRHPRVIPEFANPKTLLDRSQRGFWALDMERHRNTPRPDLHRTMTFYPLDVAEGDGTLTLGGSVYSHDDRQIRDDLSLPGPRLVTFNNILEHRVIPLPRAIDAVLDLVRDGLGCSVEIELAVDMGDWGRRMRRGQPRREPRLYVLQIRPFASNQQMTTGPRIAFDNDDLLCASSRSLGNGILSIQDLIYVCHSRWDASRNEQIAEEVGTLNARLKAAGRHYILIGPGRWGTTDPWLGIPVDWSQISAAQVILEASPAGYAVEPSQGTHFFQNLTALKVGYLTLPPGAEDPTVDTGNFLHHQWLDQQPAVGETEHLRWLHFEEPLTVVLEGRHGRAVIAKPGAMARGRES